MKIFWKIILIILPLVLIVLLSRAINTHDNFWFVDYDNDGFFGLHDFVDYFNTLDWFDFTQSTINEIGKSFSEFADKDVNFWEDMGNFFKGIGLILTLPITVVGDIIKDLVWVLGLLTGKTA